MRALFGVVGLLVVVAIVGLLAARQLHRLAPTPVAGGVVPASGASVREQAQQTERQVADDVAKALAQGAAARRDADAAAEGASQP
ncbi:MAG: hypothetical protein JSR59_06525 [Proteobacteria bacterium]|nr:hypothetical protein [Pseudomonadota bacterium]